MKPQQNKLTSEKLHILRHSLGLESGTRAKESYRNWFVTGPGSTDFELCRELVVDGFMREQPPTELTGGDSLFIVTPRGKAIVAGDWAAPASGASIETFSDRAEHSANLLTQVTEAINSLNLTGCSQDTLRELVEARDALECAIRAVEKSISIVIEGDLIL